MLRLVRLKVHADATRDALEPHGATAFEAWVREPAEQGRANAAALSLLAARLGVAAKRLRIIKGARSSSKIVSLLGS